MDLEKQLRLVGDEIDRSQLEMKQLAKREYGSGFFEGVLFMSLVVIAFQIVAWFVA
jgi:hypothetical protein